MRRLFLSLLLFCLPVMLAAQDNPIARQLAAFTEAYNAGDAAAIAQFYTEEAALLPPQAAILSGRAAIAAHYQAAFQAGVGNLRYRILEIRQHGPDAAVEIGETQVSFGANTVVGRSLHVWVRDGQGWKLSRDIYHAVNVN